MGAVFVRTQLGKLKKLKNVWRRPRGHHNKLRLGKKNRGPKPEIGYKKPSKTEEIRVYTPLQAESLKADSVIIGAGVGKKKREEILKACEKKKIKVLNHTAKAGPKTKKEIKKL
jgi:large subunit ribosomal protein L32e